MRSRHAFGPITAAWAAAILTVALIVTVIGGHV